MLLNKIVSSDKDMVGIVFFGTVRLYVCTSLVGKCYLLGGQGKCYLLGIGGIGGLEGRWVLKRGGREVGVEGRRKRGGC